MNLAAQKGVIDDGVLGMCSVLLTGDQSSWKDAKMDG